MIKHLIKIVWNRKRTNFLITVEIFFSFLVLFAVAVIAIYYIDNYRQPLGFNYQNVWNIEINVRSGGPEYGDVSDKMTTIRTLKDALKDMDGIDHVATAFNTPYSEGNWTTNKEIKGRPIDYHVNFVSEDFNKVVDLQIVKGRWFSKEDAGQNWKPVVITQRMARAFFDGEDPLGKDIDPEAKEKERVVGVITEYRKEGEFAEPVNFMFILQDMNKATMGIPRSFAIKVRPGAGAVLEEKIITTLQSTAKDWSFRVRPITEMREMMNTIRLVPVIAIGLVAGFLMLMVALGLIGVLWQNVTQRTREIGLRRAKGATAGNIYKQILGELIVIASFGLVIGTIVVVQFPLLDLIGFVSTRVYTYGFVFSVVIIYLLTIICGLYPSRMATRIHPAAALHYE